MSLRAQALQEFDLPAAPQRIEELPSVAPEAQACKVHAPAGRFLLVCSNGALSLAFEATLFDLLAESRYPAPRPRRARGGSFIAMLAGRCAAACYSLPAGQELDPATASTPQLMELGRLLARLHQLGETHPASVSNPCDLTGLFEQMAPGPERDRLAPLGRAGVGRLPAGAVHGGLRPERALFIGERCSAVLPSGLACSGPLLLDLAETAVSWMADAEAKVAALRAILSGYQALRRLVQEEQEAFYATLRFAAAVEGARRCALQRVNALSALDCVEGVGEREALAAVG
ncbi:MAG TPA: phosphotransferase [Myxococcales bacterium]